MTRKTPWHPKELELCCFEANESNYVRRNPAPRGVSTDEHRNPIWFFCWLLTVEAQSNYLNSWNTKQMLILLRIHHMRTETTQIFNKTVKLSCVGRDSQ